MLKTLVLAALSFACFSGHSRTLDLGTQAVNPQPISEALSALTNAKTVDEAQDILDAWTQQGTAADLYQAALDQGAMTTEQAAQVQAQLVQSNQPPISSLRNKTTGSIVSVGLALVVAVALGFI